MLSRTEYDRLEVQLLKSLNQFNENKNPAFDTVLKSHDLLEILIQGQRLLKKYNMNWHRAREELVYFGDEISMRDMRLLFQYRLVELGFILSETLLGIARKIARTAASQMEWNYSERLFIAEFCKQIPRYVGEKPGQLHYTLELPRIPEEKRLQQIPYEEYTALQQRYRIDARATGDTSLTSDYDITFIIPDFPEHEIDSVIRFNDLFREKFKNHEANIVFDTNIYNAAFLSLKNKKETKPYVISTDTSDQNQNQRSSSNPVNSYSCLNDSGIQYSFLSIRQCFAKSAPNALNDNEQWDSFKGQVVEEIETQLANNQKAITSFQSKGKDINENFAAANNKVNTIFNKVDQLHKTIEIEKLQAIEKLAHATGIASGQLNLHQKMRVTNDLYEVELCKVKQLILKQKDKDKTTNSDASFPFTNERGQDCASARVKHIFSLEDKTSNNLRASFCLKNTMKDMPKGRANTLGEADEINAEIKSTTQFEDTQWMEAQSRALVFANEAYFCEGAIKTAFSYYQEDANTPDKHDLFQSLLMDISYKIKHLTKNQKDRKPLQSSHIKIRAVTSAKYGIRVSRACHQLSSEFSYAPLFSTTLYQNAYQKVKPILEKEFAYQAIKDECRQHPYRILSRSSTDLASKTENNPLRNSQEGSEISDPFDSDKTLSDFIRLAATFTASFILTDHLG